MKKYAIDARWMIGDLRGMGRFANQFIASIAEDTVALLPKNMRHHSLDTSSRGGAFFPLWEQYVLNRLANASGAKFLICPYNTGPVYKNGNFKLIVVVHDLIYMRPWHELPPSLSFYQTVGRIYRRFVVPRVLRNADIIVTVSEYTKNELVTRYNPRVPVFVVPNSISRDWLDIPFVPLSKRDDYLFSVAGEAPSKNVKRLLQAFALVSKRDGCSSRLKIAGIKRRYHGSFMRIADELGIGTDVDFIDFVEQHELIRLYQHARGFIFPSLFEGFGIPLIEAMACYTPIACSNATSLPEVVAEHALFFDPKDSVDMAKAIDKLLSPSYIRDEWVVAAHHRLARFSPDTVEKLAADFWKKINA